MQLSPISTQKSLFAPINNNNHQQQHIILGNNEKFTHLIRFYQLLSKQNEIEIHEIESNLFNIFNKNIELFSKVIFHGLNSMLYKIDISMIQQFIKLCCNQKKEKNKNKNKDKDNSNKNKEEWSDNSLCNLPSDLLTDALLPFLDFNSLTQTERTCRVLLSRARHLSSCTQINVKISKLLSYFSNGYSLHRFSRVKKLTLTIHSGLLLFLEFVVNNAFS